MGESRADPEIPRFIRCDVPGDLIEWRPRFDYARSKTEAREISTGVLEKCNSLGLLPEQFDPYSGEYLGNYPQAFTHIGLINSIPCICKGEGRRVPQVGWNLKT